MQTVLVNLESCSCSHPADACNIYTNLDAVGNAAGELAATPVNPRPIPLFPGVPNVTHEHLISAHLMVPHLGPDLSDKLNLQVEVGPVHFGRLKVGLKSIDQAGNEQDGDPAETELTVNSAPRPPTGVQRGSWDSETKQQSFAFVGSRQLV